MGPRQKDWDAIKTVAIYRRCKQDIGDPVGRSGFAGMHISCLLDCSIAVCEVPASTPHGPCATRLATRSIASVLDSRPRLLHSPA